MNHIIEKLKKQTVRSCRCGTKTDDLRYHNVDCLYRVLVESILTIGSLLKEEKLWCAYCGEFGDHKSGWCAGLIERQDQGKDNSSEIESKGK